MYAKRRKKVQARLNQSCSVQTYSYSSTLPLRTTRLRHTHTAQSQTALACCAQGDSLLRQLCVLRGPSRRLRSRSSNQMEGAYFQSNSHSCNQTSHCDKVVLPRERTLFRREQSRAAEKAKCASRTSGRRTRPHARVVFKKLFWLDLFAHRQIFRSLKAEVRGKLLPRGRFSENPVLLEVCVQEILDF